MENIRSRAAYGEFSYGRRRRTSRNAHLQTQDETLVFLPSRSDFRRVFGRRGRVDLHLLWLKAKQAFTEKVSKETQIVSFKILSRTSTS